MLHAFRPAVLAMSAIALAAGACAMNPGSGSGVHCRVDRPELLPAGVGGGEAVCAEIAQAAREIGAGPMQVEVRVLTPHSLAASVRTADGSMLPEQRMEMSDREITRPSLQRFARTIAAAARARQNS